MQFYEIERFSATHKDWEGSFSERLYEYGEWNECEFWKLHKDIIELSIYIRSKSNIEKKIIKQLFGIQKSIYSILVSNFNQNDSVKITNISEDKVFLFIERLDAALNGVFTGRIIPEESFTLKNPLLYK